VLDYHHHVIYYCRMLSNIEAMSSDDFPRNPMNIVSIELPAYFG